jgi:hypothetical protein
MNGQSQADLKLFMILLGSKAPGRNVEQHDYFFGIAQTLKGLIPDIKAFWPEAGNSIHLDGWREITMVDGYRVKVIPKGKTTISSSKRLFFINLGGYQPDKLEEQHYTVLTVKEDRALAVQDAKKTIFFKTNTLKGAGSHIDEKYGIDVDDIYLIEDILSPSQKEKYHIAITPAKNLPRDQINLGYFKLDKIK